MLTLKGMRKWQRAILVPVFVLICVSFGISGSLYTCADIRGANAIGEFANGKVGVDEMEQYGHEVRQLAVVFFMLSRNATNEYEAVQSAAGFSDNRLYMKYAMEAFDMMRRNQQKEITDYFSYFLKRYASHGGEKSSTAWNYLVLVKTAEEWSLAVSDQELKERIERLVGGGDQFDQKLYTDFVYRIGSTPEAFEKATRHFMLAEKLCLMIEDGTVANLQSVFDNFKATREKRKFGYVKVGPEAYTADVDKDVKEDDVKTYFTRNYLVKYKEPRKVKMRAAVVDYSALAGDVSVTDEEIGEYYEKYKETLYVKHHSDDAITPDGGRAEGVAYYPLEEKKDEIRQALQYERVPAKAMALLKDGRDEMVKAVAARVEEIKKKQEDERKKAEDEKKKKAEENKNGEQKPEDKKPEETKPEDKKPEENPLEKTLVPAAHLLRTLDNEYAVDFDKLKDMFGNKVRIVTLDYFDPNKTADFDFLKDYKCVGLEEAGRTLKTDEISEVFATGDRACFVQGISETTEGCRPYPEMKEKARKDYVLEKAMEKAHEAARAMVDEIKGDVTVEQVAEKRHLQYIISDFVKRGGKNPFGLPKEDNLVAKVYTYKVGDLKAEKEKNNCYVVKMLEQKFPREGELEENQLNSQSDDNAKRKAVANLARVMDVIHANAKYYPGEKSVKPEEKQ